MISAPKRMQRLSLRHASLQVAPVGQDTFSEERQRLKQLSDDRSSQWPNTLSVGEAPERGRGMDIAWRLALWTVLNFSYLHTIGTTRA